MYIELALDCIIDNSTLVHLWRPTKEDLIDYCEGY